jgi:hypothetical protein
VALPRTPLTALPDVRLFRAGDGFLLVGREPEGSLVRVARLRADGKLGGEIDLRLPAPRLGPFFAPITGAGPGDRVLVVYGASGPQSPAGVALLVQALDVPPAEPTASPVPRPLTDSLGREVIVEASADLAAFQAAMGPSRGGKRAAFAWGFRDRPSAPAVVLLDPDGASRPVPEALAPADTSWDCLHVGQGRADLGVSWVGRPAGGPPTWHLADLREDASTAYAIDLEVATRQMLGCPAVAPTQKGYTIAWQNRDGTYFSSLDTTRMEVLLVSDFVKAAVRFGGPDRQPRVACIAPMGKQFGLIYDAPEGPIADRFDIFGNPQGTSLRLPGARRIDRLSALPDLDAAFFTYLSGPAGSPLDVRYFVRIECSPL